MVTATGMIQRRGTTMGSFEAERRELAGRTVSGLHPPGYRAARTR
jgi:hypothetical protein